MSSSAAAKTARSSSLLFLPLKRGKLREREEEPSLDEGRFGAPAVGMLPNNMRALHEKDRLVRRLCGRLSLQPSACAISGLSPPRRRRQRRETAATIVHELRDRQ